MNPAPLHPDRDDGHHARLLAVYVLAVNKMRAMQRRRHPTMTRWDCEQLLTAEKEVDDLTALHLLPPVPDAPQEPRSENLPRHAEPIENDAEEDELLALDREHSEMFGSLSALVTRWDQLPSGDFDFDETTQHAEFVFAIDELRGLLASIKNRRSRTSGEKTASQDAPGTTNDKPAG